MTTSHPTPQAPAARRLRRPATALAALVVATLGSFVGGTLALGVPTAAAHASLVSATPADGAVVDTPPSEVALTFSEEVRDPAFVSVSHDGQRVGADGRAEVDGATVSVPQTGTEAGAYTVAYRVVSADGHPIEGEYTFEVRNAAPSPSRAAEPSTAPGTAADPGADATPEAGTDAGTDETGTDSTSDTTEDTTEAASQQSEGGFWATNGTVVVIGVGVLLAVVALLLVGRRRGNDAG
ncbi:hypothetical protein GCM10009737_06520 [Nocardioides lentus]|uniref:CopC domain-containing protein n=1 Tax=Nocardioides lentus TaxID=338077 RepID=A0ABN2NZR8_9ACTN